MNLKFGTDGIRGPVETKVTPEACLRIGHAAGIVFKENAPTSPSKAARVILKNIRKKNRRILIGYDAHFYDIASRLFPKNFFKIIWILPFMRELLKFKKDNHDKDT